MWARLSGAGCGITLALHVQPNAKLTAFAGRHGDALKVRVAAAPIDDRANEALLGFLARSLGVPRSALTIAQGKTSRRKIVAVAGDPLQLSDRIRLWEKNAS